LTYSTRTSSRNWRAPRPPRACSTGSAAKMQTAFSSPLWRS